MDYQEMPDAELVSALWSAAGAPRGAIEEAEARLRDRVPYSSEAETRAHIFQVQKRLSRVVTLLLTRGCQHDASKLESPEKEAFDIATPKLKNLKYGSLAYKASLDEIRPALEHHYDHNSHHPEHYEEGIDGMTLLDLVEMLCDWSAAAMRSLDPNLRASLDYSAERFGIGPQLKSVLLNTMHELGFVD
jgi:hypothetical protein